MLKEANFISLLNTPRAGLVLILILINGSVIGQVALDIEKGDKSFDKLLFEEALYHYELAYEQTPEDPAITRRIANTYRRMGLLMVSAEWFRITLNLDASNDLDLIYYAEALKSLEQYDEALEWYSRYADRVPSDKRAISHLRDREYYLNLFADTLRYNMKSLDINTSHPVIGITHLEGNNYLLSAIGVANEDQRMGEYDDYLDIFQVTLDASDELINPVRLSKNVNSKYNDGPAFFSKGDQTLYITRNNIRKGKPVLDSQGTANLKIYASPLKEGQWGNADELHINSDVFSSAHACLSRDAQFIYFASNRKGGYGGTDLYVAQRTAIGWGEPVNLGPKVNTEGNEMFPFLSQDDLLYFTSDGHAGLGGTDIFVSERSAGQWLNPVNLGAPINSNHDDFNLVYNRSENKGFFCSNRNGRGNDNIYFYSLKEISKTVVAGTILPRDQKTDLAGERIRIVTVNTGMVREQRIAPDSRFNILADAGDIIEVYMVNENLFDPNELIFSFEIKKPVIEPFMRIGDQFVNISPIELRTGGIHSQFKDGLASSAINVADIPSSQASSKASSSASHEVLSPVLTDTKTGKTDLSSLIIVDGNLENNKERERMKAEFMKLGDDKLKENKPTEALEYYRAALQLYPDNSSIKSKIKEAERRSEPNQTQPTLKETGEFASAISVIDLKSQGIDYVLFKFNRTTIRDEDRATLNQIATIMKENPNTRIIIQAHCDSRGSMEYNINLSMARAAAVKTYLINNGIAKRRIQTEWFGEEQLLNHCTDKVPCGKEEHQINRRAELKIVAANGATK